MDYRIGILLVALIITYSEQCTLTADRSICRFDLLCDNILDGQNLAIFIYNDDYNRHQYDDTDMTAADSEDCSSQNLITYGGNTFGRVYLNFRQSSLNPIQPVPEGMGWKNEEVIKIIYSLNLSNNEYENTPVIKSMQNLVILDLSKNLLTTAVLSNQYYLEKLSEINLSYNTINDIQVNSNEFAYTNLKKINISHNYLVNIPDAVFDKMVGLQILDLSNNYIEGLSILTFEGIRNLLHLDLSYNRLTDINASLFRFNELKFLNLGNNRLKELKASDFEKLNKLECLDLSSNSIKKIHSNAFQMLTLLNSLDLSYNVLEAVTVSTFASLESLTNINISRNKLKFLPLNLFKGKVIFNFSVTDNLLEGSLSRGMFEGIRDTTLDLNNQLLTSIEDYAFINLIGLEKLFLRDNKIQSLSNMCLKTLINLHILDLSNNKITNLDFDKQDLINVQSLLLRNNRLVEIKQEYFTPLKSLEYLELSENAISQLASYSFNSLRNLINLKISDNPISGTLESDTFDGLVSLPSLDISRNLLTTINNASFNNMNTLKELNMSHCKIKELQYNVFIDTGYIELLDLSDNKLENLCINTTDLVNLNILLLNNNLIKTISSSSLYGLSRLSKLSLAYNALEGNIHSETFSSLAELHFLDLSYNTKFNFTEKLLHKLKNLGFLNLSGVKTDVQFTHVENTTISEVLISDADIHEIQALNLSRLTEMSTLILSHNNVSKLNMGDFSGLIALRHLDLSYNKISFIQPGAFKENELMEYLNISHNSLSVIGYGTFRGLIYLDTLDMSYNNIKDLQGERLYEVRSLSTLVVDHNKIETINPVEFEGTSLTKLSIGDNPLSCHILIKLKKHLLHYEITAIRIDEHSGENVDGITCNKDKGYEPTVISPTNNEKNDILVDIRNILYNISNKNTVQGKTNSETLNNDDIKTFENFTKVIENSITDNNEKLLELANVISRVSLNNDTNKFLARILKALQDKPIVTTTAVPLIISDNKSVDFISYIQQIKKELQQTIAEEKQNVINDLENKISLIQYQIESVPKTPGNEKLVSNIEGTKSLFTETCVGLILLILVCFVLYKFYKSNIFRRSRLSYSTRELPGAMENSNL